MYYPKAKIKENQYTSGTELIISSTRQPYTGKYYATFDGRYFTGSPGTSTSLELQKLLSNGKTTVITNAIHHLPAPTPEDYTIGFIRRYFIKRVNSGIDTIKEVSVTDYNKYIPNPLYLTISLDWKLTGPLYDIISVIPTHGIIDTNQRTVHNSEKRMPGISNYLVNLSEFSNQTL